MGNLRLGGRAVVAAGSMLAAPVLGQGDTSPLRGPEVVATRAPGVTSEYAPGGAGAGDRRVGAPAHIFFEALRGLGAETTPEEARLSPEQHEQIRAERQAFAAEVRVYVASVRSEFESLVAKLPSGDRRRARREWSEIARGGEAAASSDSDRRREAADKRVRSATTPEEPARDDGGFHLRLRSRPPAPTAGAEAMDGSDGMQAAVPSSLDEVRARLRELREAAPSVGQLRTRLWAVLSATQQQHVERVLAAYLDKTRAEEEERRLQRYLAERGRAASQTDRGPLMVSAPSGEAIERTVRRVRAGERPEWLWSRLPQHARERLDRLTSEERARAVERLLRARAAVPKERDQPGRQ